jgi:hypothetical protein
MIPGFFKIRKFKISGGRPFFMRMNYCTIPLSFAPLVTSFAPDGVFPDFQPVGRIKFPTTSLIRRPPITLPLMWIIRDRFSRLILTGPIPFSGRAKAVIPRLKQP